MVKACELVTQIGRQTRTTLICEPNPDKIGNFLQLLQGSVSIPDIEVVQLLIFATLLISRMGDMGADMVSYPVQLDQT